MRTAGKADLLEYVDETKDLEAYYTIGGNDLDEHDEFDHEGKTHLHIRTTSSTSAHQDNYTSKFQFGPLSSPSPRPEIPRSSDVFASPVKRRKTNDLAPMPLLDRANSYKEDDVRSLPDQSPAFSFLNLQSPLGPPRRPSSAQGSILNFDYGPLLSLSGFSPETRNALGFGNSPYTAFREKSSLASPPEDSASRPTTPDPQLRNGTNSSLREAVLMRYFVETLAPWFDLCDPERHFALVVPHRARTCPPLLNAIFTASARHLTRLQKYKQHIGVQWNDYYLPDLTTESAIQYHNDCISNLIESSNDPEQMHNENLLAAASILRWHEEVDAPFREDGLTEGDMFLKVINIFINAQAPATPALPHSLPLLNAATHRESFGTDAESPVTTVSDNPKPRVIRADGLRQAAFWVAFRQSIYTSFMKQRPINFPLERCIAFRTFEPAEDAVWADRLIIFCADVLQFCHGPEKITKERWEDLSAQEKKWSEVLPQSFQPIYYRAPDASRGEYFPEIWYLSDAHVTGIQHVELARILLAVYNPTMPRLGPGHVHAINDMSASLKKIVLRLCGIARGNRKTPPGMVTACMGVAMCGEHFVERGEQDALLDVLRELEDEHAWPTLSTQDALRKSWGWE